ncbi:MAG: hypothetical protein M1132_13500 [Chloroflexi bacterium]|nr:hypothetical protein [Chloroflexota bacterium]MCL5952711.1 hypothetical protein [Chloroflexota bacterium]
MARTAPISLGGAANLHLPLRAAEGFAGALLLALSFALTACGLWQPKVPGPAAPCAVTISKPAADALVQRIDAQTRTHGRTVTITATSQEITSLLNLFVDAAKQQDPSMVATMPIDHPVVCFSSGRMTLYGEVGYMGVKSTALITIAAALSDGRAAFRVERVDLGPVSVPQDLGTLVSGLINDVLNQNLSQIQLTQVQITQNQITLSGRAR